MMRRIHTFSIVVGTQACNARCPFCVSGMTGIDPVTGAHVDINERNLRKATNFALQGNTSTLLFTGKGEPTLYPEEITTYLRFFKQAFPHAFPFQDLQTNALAIGRLAATGNAGCKLSEADLREWYDLGLTTVAISTVGINSDHNRRIYTPHDQKGYPDLARTIEYLHSFGFSVRLGVMMQYGMVDSETRLMEVVEFCKQHAVEQLTVRPIRRPVQTRDDSTSAYVAEYGLDEFTIQDIYDWVRADGTVISRLAHGAEVLDFKGQNLCLTDCLTVNSAADGDDIRTLIYYASGLLMYDWQYPGAILLGGNKPKDGAGLVAIRSKSNPGQL